MVGKDSVFFKGFATGSLTMLQGQHKLDLVYFFIFLLFFGGGGHNGGGGPGRTVIGVDCVKSPNNK